jgi:hypothetical protein
MATGAPSSAYGAGRGALVRLRSPLADDPVAEAKAKAAGGKIRLLAVLAPQRVSYIDGVPLRGGGGDQGRQRVSGRRIVPWLRTYLFVCQTIVTAIGGGQEGH